MNERPTDALRSLVRHEQWAATPWEQEADALDARIAALEAENDRYWDAIDDIASGCEDPQGIAREAIKKESQS